MKETIYHLLFAILLFMATLSINAQERRPIDSQHPLWLVHVDVWNKADPQKIINLIPADIKPYICMNLSLSCQYDKDKNVYKMPQNAVRTYKSWATVCQENGMWFTCQPASGGHTHIQDNDLETFEYFFQHYPNFLGWNYAEQFWGFDETGDKSSSSQNSRIAAFAKLIPMAHKYGGFLTISFCGNIWSHPLNPIGMLKRNSDLMEACKNYPEAILWLYKYTTSSCFYNNESVTIAPFISGLTKNYGVRYDNCGWNGALDAILGKDHGKKYPVAAGIGTVMEQTGMNGGAVWDGPELIWTEDFQNLNNSNVDGYTRRNWGSFQGFRNAWIDMFRKIIDGTLYIPTRSEVVNKTKIAIINDVNNGSDEDKYATWADLYDGLYKQDDPFNKNSGQWMENYCYFKKTGRYATIPLMTGSYDDIAKSIKKQINKSSHWSTINEKVAEFNNMYPEVSEGDIFVARMKNQLITYTPYTYLNSKTTASAKIPLQYNTCEALNIIYGKLSSGVIREYADHIDFYLNNYRTDTTTMVTDKIVVIGASSQPTYTMNQRAEATVSVTDNWDKTNNIYTLTVSHNGGVDLKINCKGNYIEKNTDVLNNTSLAIPIQPTEYHGELIIEAEDMDYKNIKSCVLDPYNFYPDVRGQAGNGFMDMGTNRQGSIRDTFSLKRGGQYIISVRYTAVSGSGNMNAVVNGESMTVKCESTQTNEWKKASFTANMEAGENVLTLNNTAGINMYIDQVIFAPADQEVEKFKVTIRETEHGTATANVVTAGEGKSIQLTATPDDGYALAGWEIIHGDITIGEDNGFTMPDDIVTLSPIFADMSSVYNLDYSNILNGTMPEGWRVVQGDNDIHDYPNSYSSGSRTFTGFTGYQGKALYWRVGCAEYGRQTAYPLTLAPGEYTLSYAMAAWKDAPTYNVQILNSNDIVIATSETFTAIPNAGGNTSADLSAAESHKLKFAVATKDNYIIHFQCPGGFLEYLLLACNVNKTGTDDINYLKDENTVVKISAIYNAAGIRLPHIQRGLNILRMSDGTTRKIIIK